MLLVDFGMTGKQAGSGSRERAKVTAWRRAGGKGAAAALSH